MSDKHEVLPLLAVPATASAKPTTKPVSTPYVPLRVQGVLLVATSALAASVSSTLTKYASYSMPSMETVFWRSFGAWVLNLIALRVYNVSLVVERQYWPTLAARCFFGTLAISLQYYAAQQLVLADASVLLATSSVMTFFLGALVLGERIDPINLCFALFSFVGVTCVSRPTWLFGVQTDADATKDSVVAVLCSLTSAAGAAVSYVALRRLRQLHFTVAVNYFSLAASITSLVLLLAQGTFVVYMPLATWLAVLSTGALGFVIQILLTRGFQLEMAGVASVMVYLDVVFVFVWDSVFLRETINPWSFVGAAIICGSAIMIVLRRMHHK